MLEAGPHVFNHNMETVRRLYRRVRPQANYEQSLRVLRFSKEQSPVTMTKSGLMVGLGESAAEVHELLRHIRAAAVDVATIGQYLQPTRRNLKVAEYVRARPNLKPIETMALQRVLRWSLADLSCAVRIWPIA